MLPHVGHHITCRCAFLITAGNRDRTGTPSLERDFKSRASACSAMPAKRFSRSNREAPAPCPARCVFARPSLSPDLSHCPVECALVQAQHPLDRLIAQETRSLCGCRTGSDMSWTKKAGYRTLSSYLTMLRFSASLFSAWLDSTLAAGENQDKNSQKALHLPAKALPFNIVVSVVRKDMNKI